MRINSNRVFGYASSFLLFACKAALATGLIFWLFHQGRLGFAKVFHFRIDARTVEIFAISALSVFVGLCLMGCRFALLLRHLSFNVTFKSALHLTLIGSFFGALLPGLVGGDAVKAAYLCYNSPGRRVDALAAVALDRLLGLYSLFFLGTLAMSAAWFLHAMPDTAPIVLSVPFITIGITAVFIIASSRRMRSSLVVQRVRSLLPGPLATLAAAFERYLEAPRLLVVGVLLSVLNHGLVVVSFILPAMLLGDRLTPVAHFIINPLAMAMNLVPLTPGGIGITESTFSFLFETAGSPNGAMVGLLGRFVQYVVFALAGGFALVSTRLREDTTLGRYPMGAGIVPQLPEKASS